MTPIFISYKKFEAEVSKQATHACDHIIEEMGAEIHDDLIQKLSVFQFYMDRLEKSSRDPEEIEHLLLKMRTDFNSVTQAVRKISRRLMPVRMEGQDFQTSIELLCQNMAGGETGNIHLSTSGNPRKISETTEHNLYRIVQELIHNAFKHSAAWHISVRMKWEPRILSIEVEDDGTNFQKPAAFINTLNKKYNTLKMRSRAINANISYHRGENGLVANVSCPF
jgi:signal transduction histidine kinase